MATSSNPFKQGDTVHFKRGAGYLNGTVQKTVLARCHILELGEAPRRVFVEDYHHVKRGLNLSSGPDFGAGPHGKEDE